MTTYKQTFCVLLFDPDPIKLTDCHVQCTLGLIRSIFHLALTLRPFKSIGILHTPHTDMHQNIHSLKFD